jgi:hypothetical protein
MEKSMEKVASVGIIWYLFGGALISYGVPVGEPFQYGLAIGGMIAMGVTQLFR